MSAGLRIGMLSRWNPYDRQSFSGTIFYMRRALEDHPRVAELRVLGGHRPLLPMPLERAALKLSARYRASRKRDIALADIDAAGLDAIIAPVGSDLVAAYGAELDPPVIFVTDATPDFLVEFYGKPASPAKSESEARALQQAAATVYSSHYMAQKAAREFPAADPARLHAVPFGLNVDDIPAADIAKPPLSPLNLTFIGRDWARKGGAIAVEACRILQQRGRAVSLTVIGARVPEGHGLTDLRVHPVIDKNRRTGQALFAEILEQTHFLVLPTRADCTPMVIAEANAFGCPAIVTDTGGIGTLVQEGRNGTLVAPQVDAAGWADIIEALSQSEEDYRALSRSSAELCRTRLTWTAWADDVLKIIAGLRDQGREAKMENAIRGADLP